jgi:AcrR family transcriptional regulator
VTNPTKRAVRVGSPTKRASAVRGRVLDAASGLFYQRGLRATGIDRLLEQAGAAKASLYAHFPSKDDLIAAYLTQQAARRRELVERRLADSGADARGRLLLLFDLLVESVGKPEFRGCPFQKATGELADPAHPGRKPVQRYRAWFRNLVRRLIVDAGAEPEPLTRTLIVLHEGALATALMDDDPRSAFAARWGAEHLLSAAIAKHHE